jgi:hypothetical protein
VEDSTGCMHGSHGVAEPAADTLLSEAGHRRGLAKATLEPNPKCRLGRLGGRLQQDPRRHRQAFPRSSTTSTSGCGARRLPRPVAARQREWKTRDGKANFTGFGNLHADPDMPERGDVCCG